MQFIFRKDIKWKEDKIEGEFRLWTENFVPKLIYNLKALVNGKYTVTIVILKVSIIKTNAIFIYYLGTKSGGTRLPPRGGPQGMNTGYGPPGYYNSPPGWNPPPTTKPKIIADEDVELHTQLEV